MRISDWSSDVCSSDLSVVVCEADRPLALTFGIRRPTVLLSDWMVRCLDVHELESVLAHEVGHVVRRDSLARSESCRAGKECVSTCRSRWLTDNSKNKKHRRQAVRSRPTQTHMS